ncbi:LysR substrate-binding domain-containing protein [Streptomyces niveiscabiei]|uniref:LysR family transcriptional regulator n=1 Tax=Streptomyces niveiscabiei TaxID=164115 RepID=UPI0029A0714C|nr:LysR substrate-binding domain-containing protein [Streptomyces niveiscabiei]MDX3383216.1 LysR substrate-binding domain-containing protein [Streptomyces niveiscabiei]
MRASVPKEPSIHQLRLYLALSEELHFGRAAARLFITQPALSQQIRELEKRLGVPVVERTSRTITLTEAGQALLPEARAAVAAVDRLRHVADAQVRQTSGRLVVGTMGAEASMAHTRAVLGLLQTRHPGTTVQLVDLGLGDHLAALAQQEVDVVFLRPPVTDDIELHHLATEPRVACLPAGHPLAALPRLTLAQLSGVPVVSMPEQVPRLWWDFWAVDPRPDGSRVQYGPMVTDMESLLYTVAAGEAMCFLPAAARDYFPRPGIRYLDVVDLAPSTSALAWLRRRRSESTIEAVRHAAHEATRQGLTDARRHT